MAVQLETREYRDNSSVMQEKIFNLVENTTNEGAFTSYDLFPAHKQGFEEESTVLTYILEPATTVLICNSEDHGYEISGTDKSREAARLSFGRFVRETAKSSGVSGLSKFKLEEVADEGD
ncbi:hypothetical protein CMI42_04955 [Candidatus Pacearchaeota archaeon]|jgi:hypothetical protein|nr:hypothetical protein [Candidatus Pacearchaeota archaeon]|tara:strand:+ start:793 stop:1152 length:360 start_codon:yes stop_codon:yes gene_type:complete